MEGGGQLFVTLEYRKLYRLYYTCHIYITSYISCITHTYIFISFIFLCLERGLKLIIHTLFCCKQFNSSFSSFWRSISFFKGGTDLKHFAFPFGNQFHQCCFTLVKYLEPCIVTIRSMYKQYIVNDDRIQSLCNLSDTHELLNLTLIFVGLS